MEKSNLPNYDKLIVELASRGLTNYIISDLVQVDESTVRRALKREGYKKHLLPVQLEGRFAFDIDKPIVIRDTDCMVTADWHIPLYNEYLVNEMIEHARSMEVKTLLIGGDFFNFDALSSYDPKQDEAGLAREVQEACDVLQILAETFDRIVIIWGNHDSRLHRSLGYKMQFASAMYMVLGQAGREVLEKVEISNLDHLWVEFSDATPERSQWRLCHPATYSRVALSTPRTLAAKFNSNVICAHAHHSAIGFATDGVKTVAEIGGLFNQHKTAYLQRSTTFPTWTPGYGWFKDGHFHMTTPAWSV